VGARAIVHVDMDAFYASIEQRDRPELRGRPVVVGADPRGRGVVSAASYEARPFGIRSAMPIGRAARLCPHAAFLPVDMDKYQRVSRQVMQILAGFSPLVEPVSVDEAFVDLTGTVSLFGEPVDAARLIKQRIHEETGLTASAGVAPNKFLAKVASDLEKPDGLVVVAAGGEREFLAPLPIERLWGVGKVMTKELATMGIHTIAQLHAVPATVLAQRFGSHGEALHDLAFGRDHRAVTPWTAPKSMGAEHTFDIDTTDMDRLRAVLREHAERVARELRESELAASCVALKLRFADFRTLTRRHTGDPTQDGLEIYRRAERLFSRETLAQPIRLIGVSTSAFTPAGHGQLTLLDPAALRRERLSRALDAITERHGDGAVVPAELLRRRIERRPRPH
jgi:DNA polymerase IV